MRNKYVPAAVATAVVLLSAACSSGGGTSSAQGKENANQARKTTAQVYWKLYDAAAKGTFTNGGNGHFAKCEDEGPKSVNYIVRALVSPKSDKGATQESLTQTVATQLAGAGWQLSPSSGVERSAKKGGVTVKVEPPEFIGDTPMEALQVESKCVDAGDATDFIIDGSAQTQDRYGLDDSAPVPTAFPSPSP